jgi:hypothetical protein
MADGDSTDTLFSASELIAAQTQELVEALRANQRELEARVAETTEIIDRTRSILEESATGNAHLGGQEPEQS